MLIKFTRRINHCEEATESSSNSEASHSSQRHCNLAHAQHPSLLFSPELNLTFLEDCTP
jgi:hypothetical protein